jgi:tRNA nucleotidyltransferase/poly(A) polymerase
MSQANFLWIEKIRKVLNKIPGEWRFVGGCVRDSLLGIQVADIDITTTTPSDEIEKSMKEFTLNTIGKKFGTIGVFYKGFAIEITTARRDVKTFGRSAEVSFSNVTFEEDSERRDFTINSLMLDVNGKIYDYHNGLEDLKAGIVRFVGDGNIRIQEDYLRLLRYIRFFVRFNKHGKFDMDLVKQYVYNISILSKERIIQEMESMCSKPNTKYAFELMNECGISKIFWQNDLYTNIDNSLTSAEKFAYAIWNFYDLKAGLPLNRNVKYLISLRKPTGINDIYMHCAVLWNKHKDSKVVLDYLKIHEHFYQEKINVFFDLNNKIFEQFEGINRGKAELVGKYYSLQGMQYNHETINNNINKFENIKLMYK